MTAIPSLAQSADSPRAGTTPAASAQGSPAEPKDAFDAPARAGSRDKFDAALANIPAPKVALVTGGTRGIGLATAHALAADGYDLVLGYNSDAAAADQAQAALTRDHGVRVHCIGGDVAKPATLDALFDCVKTEFGGTLTAFVHNAGLHVGVTSGAEASEPPGPNAYIDNYTYYHAVYVLAFRGLMDRARACDGLRHVVAISSPGCNMLQRPVVAYEEPGQAKAGMEMQVRCFAKQAGARYNVNCVIPGLVRTEAWDKLFVNGEWGARERVDGLAASTPLGSWIEPSQIGEVVSLLCSKRSELFTGCTFFADGGMHLG